MVLHSKKDVKGIDDRFERLYDEIYSTGMKDFSTLRSLAEELDMK